MQRVSDFSFDLSKAGFIASFPSSLISNSVIFRLTFVIVYLSFSGILFYSTLKLEKILENYD